MSQIAIKDATGHSDRFLKFPRRAIEFFRDFSDLCQGRMIKGSPGSPLVRADERAEFRRLTADRDTAHPARAQSEATEASSFSVFNVIDKTRRDARRKRTARPLAGVLSRNDSAEPDSSLVPLPRRRNGEETREAWRGERTSFSPRGDKDAGDE